MYIFYLLPGFILVLLMSCSETPPDRVRVLSRLVGTYCGRGAKLEINEDSSFVSYRNVFSFGDENTDASSLKCKGNYRLIFHEDSYVWTAGFDGRQTGLMKCRKEFTIWEPARGFHTDTLQDIIGGTLVIRGNCR